MENSASFRILCGTNLAEFVMLRKSQYRDTNTLFSTLEEQLDCCHPICKLASKIDWELFEREFSPLYHKTKGRPAKSIRLMVGLLILKHLRNLSDESVVLQWSENAYYQYFCGEISFVPTFPCNSSELVHFRKRIGERGIELILKESIRVNDDDEKSNGGSGKGDDIAFIDTTVQEKNITYPTDAKLHRKIINKCHEIIKKEELPMRQSYKRELKELALKQRFRNHPKNGAKARKADKRVKTIAGRLVRELDRNLVAGSVYRQYLELFYQVLAQTKHSKNKIYSLHEPEVKCISKGKEHKKFEFGNKVSIIRSQRGVILGAKSFRNEYDGHTIEPSLEQVEELTGKLPKTLAGDRGYRGVKVVKGVKIVIPDAGKKSDTRYQKEKNRKLFRKRAGLEPTIGHLKSDSRLGCNFYKGMVGDAINIMLAAAAYNFKRAMSVLCAHILLTITQVIFQKLSNHKKLAVG